MPASIGRAESPVGGVRDNHLEVCRWRRAGSSHRSILFRLALLCLQTRGNLVGHGRKPPPPGGLGYRFEGRGALRYTGEWSLASVGRPAYSTKACHLGKRAGQEAHPTRRSGFITSGGAQRHGDPAERRRLPIGAQDTILPHNAW